MKSIMQIQKNISLKPYNTFGIDVQASHFCSVDHEADLIPLLKNNTLPLFIMSGGSNMLLTQPVHALVILINTKGIQIEKHENHALVTAKAGENWHDFVQFCIRENLGGLENLSLIPGCVGSSPIQNIGAYGIELKDSFVSCKTLDRKTLETKVFSKEACEFGYRNSIFKNEAKDQYIITEVTFKLTTNSHLLHTGYGAIEEALKKHKNINTPTIQNIADAVISIRKSKLPDPKIIGNSGSFFKNPIISKTQYEDLVLKFPEAPHYPVSKDLVKVPAGWLIDNAGFKGFTYKNAGVHDKQALVLVNKTGNASGAEIWKLATLIQEKIKVIYGINLETEVNIF